MAGKRQRQNNTIFPHEPSPKIPIKYAASPHQTDR
jgi:hypothetical protein